jgi:hypothetical protein
MVAVTLSERLRCCRAGREDKVLYVNTTAGGAVDHDWVGLLPGLDPGSGIQIRRGFRERLAAVQLRDVIGCPEKVPLPGTP